MPRPPAAKPPLREFGREFGRALAVALVVALGACRTTESEAPPASPPANILRTEPVRAWRLVEQGELLGVVVHFADPASPELASRQYFSVRNRWQQELGTLDAQGRAYRFVPHQREAQWIGTGTVLEGARGILGGSAKAELVELSLDELRGLAASAR